MTNLDSYVSGCRMERILWSTSEFLRVYAESLGLWNDLGWTPDRVSGVRPSRPGYYDEFDESKRDPAPEDVDNTKAIELEKMASGCRSDSDWAARLCLSNFRGNGVAHQMIGLSELGITEGVAITTHERFLHLVRCEYAYIFRQQRRFGYYRVAPTVAEIGPGRNREHDLNVSWWSMENRAIVESSLLRDVYPRSFLSRRYLDAPVGVGGPSLGEWITDSPIDRGELRTFTDTLTEWSPPTDRIPQLREELFRAGRIFYWRFFCPQHGIRDRARPEPLYRPDPTEPWEAPEPIPEVFTAAYYKDKDPGLVY